MIGIYATGTIIDKNKNHKRRYSMKHTKFSNSGLRHLVGPLSALAAMTSMALPAHAWTYTATGQWASFNFGNWTVYQNEWGSSVPATLYANSASDWATSANWTGSGTKGYAHAQLNPNINLNPYSNWAVSGFSSISNPSNGQGNWFFDVWTEGGDELMIEEWDNNSGSWGSQISGPVTIGGHSYNSVWFVNGAGNGFHNVVIFRPSSNHTSESSIDLMAFLRWANGKGCLTNYRLSGWDFGIEETIGNGQWTCYGFWGAWG